MNEVSDLLTVERGKKGRIDGLEARGASERTLQPVIDAVLVVSMHARQHPQKFAFDVVTHADNAPGRGRKETVR